VGKHGREAVAEVDARMAGVLAALDVAGLGGRC